MGLARVVCPPLRCSSRRGGSWPTHVVGGSCRVQFGASAWLDSRPWATSFPRSRWASESPGGYGDVLLYVYYSYRTVCGRSGQGCHRSIYDYPASAVDPTEQPAATRHGGSDQPGNPQLALFWSSPASAVEKQIDGPVRGDGSSTILLIECVSWFNAESERMVCLA